jgi:transcriptional regulator with XRE-family HTH domain
MSMKTDGHGSFGYVLRRARRHAGLTQELLAERAGISVRAITDLERGVNRSPRRDTLEMLADALELSADARAEWERLRRFLAVRNTSAELQATSRLAETALRPNVPTPLDDLLGRDDDLANVLSLLSTSRLITLT